jgi:hypothetical protein
METNEAIPRALRDHVAADLRPVRPLLQPWQRVACLLPIGALLFLGVPLALFAVRSDAGQLGIWLAWGGSVLEFALAGVIAFAAFRDVVPGRTSGPRSAALVLALSGAVVLAMTWLTWSASPITAPSASWGPWTVSCLRVSFRDGLPLLIILLVLAGRGLVAQPALVGGLCGLGAGLVSDAGWRMVCSVSEPSHVVLGHLGAVAALTALGAVLLPLWGRASGRLDRR